MCRKGIAIVLAWPETYCKNAGSWYDGLMSRLRISINGFYRVGHSAIVLIDSSNGSCHYFDFGRYHTPVGNGRVRDVETDNDLTIPDLAGISGEHILAGIKNISEGLESKSSCHGQGQIIYSSVVIDFDKAYSFAKGKQLSGALPYGPFVINGSNCSRFVRSVLLNSGLRFTDWLKIKFLLPFTPTPASNVSAFRKGFEAISHKRAYALPANASSGILPPPERVNGIALQAKWLSGEGAGSWFYLRKQENNYSMHRYSPSGEIECKGIFKLEENNTSRKFNISQFYEMDYLSHCQQIKVRQQDCVFVFNRIADS